MSNCEQCAQVAQDKWATVSESLRLLMKNERFAQVTQDKWANERSTLFFEQIAHFSLLLTKNEQCTQKNSKKSYFLYVFYSFFGSFLKKQTICSFLLNKVSESRRSLRANEQPWGIRSGWPEGMSDCEQIAQVTHQKWAKEQIAPLICSLFWQENKQFAAKFDERIPNPGFVVQKRQACRSPIKSNALHWRTV